ncbi:MAG TPA: YfhO family protein, partial [Pyrinomonadaceae bacterium]|nr:YfhO family protein [Pyrinomonadaceae bacterium]
VFFWLTVAILAWILMLGGNSPLYKLIYQVPFLNRFRVPARHSFEWTFAASILAAYGWDAITTLMRNKPLTARLRRQRFSPLLSVALLVTALIVALLWWTAVYHSTGEMYYSRTPYPPQRYLLWKAAFLIALFAGAWFAWSVPRRRFRTAVLTIAVVIACFPEPYTLLSRWWFTAAKPARRFELTTPSTKFLQTAPQQNRVYSRVNLFVEENAEQPALDPLNLTAIFGLHNVGIYEPLILERYSRALDNVGYDSVTTRPGWKSESTIFDDRSHVLDILNTRYVLTYKNTLYAEGCPTISKDGIKVSTGDAPVELAPGAAASLAIDQVEADSLALVTSLSNGAGEPQDSTVAALRFFDIEGRVYEHSLRAGIETAEWAHERSDVRTNVRHNLATVFDGRPGDLANTFTAYKYWARVNFPERLRIKRLDIVNTSPSSTVVVWQGSLHNSEQKLSTPLTNPLVSFESQRWNVSPGKPGSLSERINFTDNQGPVELRPGESVTLKLQTSSGDTLALVTSLAHAAAVEQKSSVAKVSIILNDGKEIAHDLRAGVDTAEWAHERAEVRATVRHQLAEVFDSHRVAEPDNFTAHRYWTRMPLNERVNNAQIRIVNTSDVATIAVWKAALFDFKPSTTTSTDAEPSGRWATVYDQDNVLIYQNNRTLPRAWLVGEIAATEREHALKVIRGEADPAFDPKQKALVETDGRPLPVLAGGKLPGNASAAIVSSKPHSLTIQTDVDQPAFLVVSESAYPGWVASIDGTEVPIYVTNYLLRGVAVPAGSHRVEMKYTAPWAMVGALVSIFSLLSLAMVAFWGIKATRLGRAVKRSA